MATPNRTFENAGIVFLNRSWKRIVIKIDEKEYFVKLKDLNYALAKESFRASVFRAATATPTAPKELSSKQNVKSNHLTASFSVVFNEEEQGS